VRGPKLDNHIGEKRAVVRTGQNTMYFGA
jgi:hypothetical protein